MSCACFFVPTNESDVTTALAIARELKVPLLARGGGSSQCGQTTGECLVIDNSKYLNQVIEFEPDGTDAIPRLFDEFDRYADATALLRALMPRLVPTSATVSPGKAEKFRPVTAGC